MIVMTDIRYDFIVIIEFDLMDYSNTDFFVLMFWKNLSAQPLSTPKKDLI